VAGNPSHPATGRPGARTLTLYLSCVLAILGMSTYYKGEIKWEWM